MTIHTRTNNDPTPTVFRSAPDAFTKAEMPMADDAPALLVMLRRTLADAVTLYLRANGFHWNVIGADFAQYHSLFGDIYSDVYDSVDRIAENIRKMGGIAPFRLPELMALRSIVDAPVESALPVAMAADLLNGNEAMLVTLNAAFVAANAANEQGIANFLAERIDQHQKWSWQLRSSLAG